MIAYNVKERHKHSTVTGISEAHINKITHNLTA